MISANDWGGVPLCYFQMLGSCGAPRFCHMHTAMVTVEHPKMPQRPDTA